MRRLPIATAVLLALAPLAAPAPADAVEPPTSLGSIRAGGPGVLYTHDLLHGSILTIPTTVPFDVRWDAPAPARWRLSVRVTAPDGSPVGSRDLVASEGLAREVDIRQAEPGVYTMAASGQWEDDQRVVHDFTLAPSSFAMRRPRSRVAMTATGRRTPHAGHLLRVRGAVWGEGPHGEHAVLDARVTVEELTGRGWRPVRSARLARWNTYVVRYPCRSRRAAVRAVVRAPGYDSSVSRVVRLRLGR